jgi:DNA-binding NarL/FixJ family response regulator
VVEKIVPMQVLIVDDNKQIRELIRAILGDVAEVFECSDGDEAVAAYLRYRPDWVVMDVRMPRIGGIAATRLLKRRFPGVRVVMLSKHSDEDIQAAAAEAGASGYLLKDDLSVLRRFLLERKN